MPTYRGVGGLYETQPTEDDVTIEVHDGVLTIRGEKRDERDERKEQARHIERFYGSFSRSFSLPSNADGEHVKARFDQGVLTITVPKLAASKPRVVAIKS